MLAKALKKVQIILLSKINQAHYMKIYVKYLKDKGINIRGCPVYIAPDVNFDSADCSLISIGDKSVISFGVTLLVHDYSIARALNAIGENVDYEPFIKRPVLIGNNCFVGCHSVLCPGVNLGNDCIVGAGAIVRAGNYPNGSIITGNPAAVTGNTYEWAEKKKQNKSYLVNEHPTELY